MSRVPDPLAPPWLPRQQRRHVDRALRKLIHRNACSVCGVPFEPNTGTATGFDASGAVALVGECCTGKLTEIFGLGFDFPLPTGAASELADIARRSGVDGMVQVSVLDSAWKDDDRKWFERNPTRAHRVRPPFPGEYDAEAAETPPGHVLIVLVRQIEPGRRIRATVSLNAGLLPLPDGPREGGEAVAHALFEVAMQREPAPSDGAALNTLIKKYSVAWGAGQ